MKYLVFGGAGFVGSQLVKDLLNVGHKVLVYDNFFAGKRHFLPQNNEKFTIIQGDILDLQKVTTVMLEFNPAYIIHLAAVHYIPYCDAHPIETIRVNIEGTQSILESCKKKPDGIKKFIFVSSAAVYPIKDGANSENDPVLPSDIYGVTKICCEQLVELFYRETGIPSVSLRLFNSYGPNETNPHVFPEILCQIKKSRGLSLGNIEAKRDFIFTKDVSKALVKIAEKKDSSYKVFNLGTGKEYAVKEIIEFICSMLGKSIEIKVDQRKIRKIDRMHLIADITAITNYINWKPEYDIKSGLHYLLKEMEIL